MTAPKAMSPAAQDQSSNNVIDAAKRVVYLRHDREKNIAIQEKALLADAANCWDAVHLAAALIQGYGIPASALKRYHDEGRRARKVYAIKFPKNPDRKSKK